MSKFFNPNNYFKFLIHRVILLLAPIIRLWEKKYINQYSSQPLKHQPVFIIGAPRTGSTILYQTITNQLDLLYVDNLVCKFDKNFFFGFWLSNKLFQQKAHNCFRSNHGDTTQCGWHAPSECGSYWYRWLPKDKHFINYNDIDDSIVEEIKKEIVTIINYFDKPIVFKNLNAGQRMRLIQKIFPNAKFIFAKRETVFTAQSILKAKRKVRLKDNEFWSVMPKNIKELRRLSNGYEQTVKQIYFLEKQIEEDKNLFLEKNFIAVDYCELNNYQELIEKLKTFIHVDLKKDFENPKIELTEKFSLMQSEIEKLQKEIKKLDWSFYDK